MTSLADIIETWTRSAMRASHARYKQPQGTTARYGELKTTHHSYPTLHRHSDLPFHPGHTRAMLRLFKLTHARKLGIAYPNNNPR